MQLSTAIVLIGLLASISPPVKTGPGLAHQVTKCKVGYTWDEKKQKCVRKGLDY